MTTPVNKNEYGFALREKGQQHIKHTNATTRKLLFNELVVVVDASSNAFIGIVQEIDGIAASGGVGKVELYEGDVISTQQVDFVNDTFVVDDSNVFVVIQDNSGPAVIRQATAAGRFPLKALIVGAANVSGGNIELRMPTQDGNIVAAV
jgi:hypothetical protein